MSLHTNGCDRKPLLYQRAEEVNDTLHLLCFVHREVIIEQLYRGVCLMGILEGKGNIVCSQYLIEETLPGGTVILKSLIDDIPCVNTTLEMTDYRIDMFTHTFLQYLCRHQVPLFVIVEPGSTLGVPYQTMSHHLQTCSLCLIDKLVSQGEVIDTLLRMNHLAFHAVLSNHPVKVLGDDSPVGSLFAIHLPLVDTDTRIPVVTVSIP